MTPLSIAIISTHPIQYNVPLLRMLASQFNVKVFYTWSQRKDDLYDENFGQSISWDIPLFEGYAYEFVANTARKPGNSHFFGIVCPSLIDTIEKWGATHVLVFGWNFQAHLKAIRYFNGKIPVLFRGDSHLLDEKNIVKQIARRNFLKWVYSFIDIALYVGENNKKYYLKHGLKEEQLQFAPHAVDNEHFFDSGSHTYELKAQQWRHKIGIKDEDVVILFAGKFEKKKNPALLLKAVKSINEKIASELADLKSVHLVFVGNGPLENQLKQLAGSDPFIHFLPFQNQSQMPLVYRLGDIFCLPSQGPGETWGLAVNEAMACSRPVIVSDKVGCAIDL